jgi:leader peptidase (prepilin peptidase)/N-methyltransferase
MGACIGSYLNVVIYRIPLGISTREPARSFCPSCKYSIPFYHNIPLVSWLLLRGKCANCGAGISVRYWFVELITALFFVAAFYHGAVTAGNVWLVVPYWILLSLFIAGTYIDLDHYLLPDEITLGGSVVGLLCSAIVPNFLTIGPWWQNLLHSLAGAAVGAGVLYAVVELGKLLFGKKRMVFDSPLAWEISQADGADEPSFILDGEGSLWTEIFNRPTDRLIIHCPQALIDGIEHKDVILTIREGGVDIDEKSGAQQTKRTSLTLEEIHKMTGECDSVTIPREAMGLGDVKFMALVGAFLGWKGVLFTIFAGSVLGACLAVLLIVTGHRQWAQKVPFGPYLALGATTYLFYGQRIIQWYFSLGGRSH